MSRVALAVALGLAFGVVAGAALAPSRVLAQDLSPSEAAQASETSEVTEVTVEARVEAPELPARPAHEVTRNAVLLYPWALFRRGLTLGYERAFPEHHLSVLGRVSFDRRAGGDFESNALALGVEGRWYFLGRGLFTKYDGPAPVGPYFGGRGAIRQTWMTANGGRDLGTARRLTLEGSFGVRFTIAARAEITPYVAMLFNRDKIPGLEPRLRPLVLAGLTLGATF